ncbi:MAG: hypothetical protein ABI686_13895, partial [Acidobacteriota bacterium]
MLRGKIETTTAMRKIIMLIVFVLFAVCAVQAQLAEDKTIVSDEFNFIAFFPDKPTYNEGDINTRFGKGYSRRWTLETPDVFYEVSVTDFPDLSVKMDSKSLNSFYDVVCSDFVSQYGTLCDNHGTNELFGEFGKDSGSRTKNLFVCVQMYLAQKRLYQLKHIMRTSLENDKQALSNLDKFWNEFVFVHRKENEKKFTYGLPKSLS